MLSRRVLASLNARSVGAAWAVTTRREERGFAKKGGKGGKGGKKGADEDEVSGEVDFDAHLKDFEAMLKRTAIAKMEDDLEKLRTGRADPRMLDRVKVKAHASSLGLSHVAQVSSLDAKTLQVSVFDPDLVAAVDKAIRAAGLDLNPQIAGTVLKIPIPKLTQETRQKLVKQAGLITEEAKTVARRVRQTALNDKAIKALEKDDKRVFEKQLQAVLDKNIAHIDAAYKKKEKELMEG